MAEEEGFDARTQSEASLNEVKATLKKVSNPIFLHRKKY